MLYFEFPEFKNKSSIFDGKQDILYSDSINYPKLETGFNHWYHQCKNYLDEEIKKMEGKKKVWKVLNMYEPTIDNYDNTLNNLSKTYFNLNIDITSESFYKMWEMIFYFNLAKNKEFISAHINDNYGSFLQAILFYREKFNKNDDKYYYIKLKKTHINEVQEDINDELKTNYKKKIVIVEDINKTNIKCDLVTATGYINVSENVQETYSTKLLFNEILNSLKILKKNGIFILRVFETFTNISLKIFAILSDIFEKIHVIKPMTSNMNSSEKYIVCVNLKDSSKIKIIEELCINFEKTNENIVDIYVKYDIPEELLKNIIKSNTVIANNNYKCINAIVAYLRNQIFSGDEYYKYKNLQISGTEYWTNLFYPNKENDNSDKIKKLLI